MRYHRQQARKGVLDEPAIEPADACLLSLCRFWERGSLLVFSLQLQQTACAETNVPAECQFRVRPNIGQVGGRERQPHAFALQNRIYATCKYGFTAGTFIGGMFVGVHTPDDGSVKIG